jgi:hypothetical protein
VCFICYVCFVTVTVICRVVVFPLSHWRIPLPRIAWPTKRQCPRTRVCFLWVTTSFHFPRMEGPTTQPATFYIYHHSLHCLLLIALNNGFVEWGWTRFCSWVVASAVRRFLKPISHWKVRVTSDRCVMLEATHRSKRCCKLGAHMVSSAWCKCTSDGTTPVVASGTAHMHG